MRILLCSITTILLLSTIAHGQNRDLVKPAAKKDNSALIYGPGMSFRIMPPRGWSQDSTPHLMHGEHTVFFPVSQKWQTAPLVIYIGVKAYDGKLSEFIESDLLSYKKTKKDIVIKNGHSIKVDEGGRAEVREVLGDEYGNYAAIAYIQEKTGVVMVIMISKNETRYESNYERFETVVRSYRLME